MAIHIDEIQTDVQVDTAPAQSAQPQPDAPGRALQRHRELQLQMLCDDSRTSAHGNED